MNIREIAQRLNYLAKQYNYKIANLQSLREGIKNKRKATYSIFGAQSIIEKDRYAFHLGGRSELQFNVGIEDGEGDQKGKNLLRYGLGLSFEPSQTVPNPLEQMKKTRSRFNRFIESNPSFCKDFQMWYYRGTSIQRRSRIPLNTPCPIVNDLEPRLYDFFFIGRLSEKSVEQFTDKDFEDVLKVLDQLLFMYEDVELVDERMARICWNLNGWTKPSGKEGKSKDKDSYERTNGFGYDEWLFDFDKLIDGYHYGFLQPLDRRGENAKYNYYDFTLYTNNSSESQWYWVGEIRNAKIVEGDELDRVVKIYQEQGWMDEMLEQIKEVGGNPKALKRQPEWIANIKFKPEQVKLYDGFPVPFEEGEKPPSPRYQLFHKKGIPTFKLNPILVDTFQPNTPLRYLDSNGSLKKIHKTSTRKTTEHQNHHAGIQNAFHEYLNKNYPKRTQREAPTGLGNTKIDLKFKDEDDQFIFYEVKSYPTLKESIRIALGQLMEYAYFPSKMDAKELVIVSSEKADSQIIEYIEFINKQFKLPLGYIQFDFHNQEVLQAINCTNV